MLWLKFYTAALDDPKIQRLDPPLFKTWVNLLCLAGKNNGALPPLVDMAFALRLDESTADLHLMRLIEVGLIDDDNGSATPHNWQKWQGKQDATNAERQRRFRQRQQYINSGNAVTNDAVTPLDKNRIEKNREEKNKKEKILPPLAPLAEFEKFWNSYPKRVGKGAAMKAWRGAVKKTPAEQIIQAVSAYPFSDDRQYIPHPATWLNQERWGDEAVPKEPEDVKAQFTKRIIEFCDTGKKLTIAEAQFFKAHGFTPAQEAIEPTTTESLL